MKTLWFFTPVCLATNNACSSNSSSHQLVRSSAEPGSPLPASCSGTFKFLGITNNCSRMTVSKRRHSSGEPDYRMSALAVPSLKSSSEDQMKEIGMLITRWGCVRSVIEWDRTIYSPIMVRGAAWLAMARAASCPLSATFVVTNSRAGSFSLQLAVQKAVSATEDVFVSIIVASFHQSWLWLFQLASLSLLLCSFTPGWIPKD